MSVKIFLWLNLFFLVGFFSVSDLSLAAEKLGKYPLCEPSALIEITCLKPSGKCLLIGDNEIDDAAFVFPINSNKFDSQAQQNFDFKQFKINDLEAIASLENNRLVLFGSHSRNSKCSVKKSRKSFAIAQIKGKHLQLVKQVKTKLPINSENLFTQKNQMTEAVSMAIDRAEQAANLAEGNYQKCQQIDSFNIEGAVALPNSSNQNVWVGLRSPLVNWQQKDWAILLHLTNLDEFTFDAVALVDLKARGIRELTIKDNFIWGIAGGPKDDVDNFFLWKFPIDSLTANATIEPQTIKSVSSFTEGLAIVDSQAYLVIDGDLGKSNSQCKSSGKYEIVNLTKN